VGVISHRSLLRLVAQGSGSENPRRLTVDVIMKKDPLTVNPETPTLEAIHLMRAHKVGCLPVVRNEKLVGIITEHDFIRVAGALLEERLQES
jgi:CBS domain-containing protein